MKSQATIEAERRGIKLSKMPEWMFDKVREISDAEDRSQPKTVMLLLQVALVHMERLGCKNIPDFMDKMNVTTHDSCEIQAAMKVAS